MAAADRAHAACNTTGQTREENKEEAAGFLQQVAKNFSKYNFFFSSWRLIIMNYVYFGIGRVNE